MIDRMMAVGQEKITLRFTEAYLFSDGYTKVKVKTDWGCIDNKGKEIVPIMYEEVKVFKNTGFAVKLNSYWGLYNTTGTLVTPIEYDDLKFIDNLILAEKNGKWLYLDENGSPLFGETYDKIEYFSEDLAPVKQGAYWGFINREGKVVIEFVYDYA